MNTYEIEYSLGQQIMFGIPYYIENDLNGAISNNLYVKIYWEREFNELIAFDTVFVKQAWE